jgi:peptidoglycan/LPS O-acetylase OafA/YrhL
LTAGARILLPFAATEGKAAPVPSSLPQQKHRFVVLDGMRGVAAILVMIAHASDYGPQAYLAVDLFFALSGFVLAYGFGDRLTQKAGLPEARLRFAIGRLIRLYPLYAVGSAIALVPVIGMAVLKVYFYTPGVLALSLVAAPLFIPLPYLFTFPLDPPAWSLSFELIANAIFCFAAWRRLPAIILVVCSAPLLFWSIRQWTVWFDGEDHFWYSLLENIPRVLFSYFLGVLMCRLWCSGRLPKFGVHPLLLFIALIVLYLVHPQHQGRYVTIIIFFVQPVLIWIGACSTAKGWTSRLAIWLGMISYGVYILHAPILMWIEAIQRLANPALLDSYDMSPLSVYLLVPIAILASHWLTLHFEIPTRRRLTARLNRWIANRSIMREAVAAPEIGL